MCNVQFPEAYAPNSHTILERDAPTTSIGQSMATRQDRNKGYLAVFPTTKANDRIPAETTLTIIK
jgi:hypothetical protein